MGAVLPHRALTLVLAPLAIVTLRSGPRSRHRRLHSDRVSVSVCHGVRVTPGTAVQSGTDIQSHRILARNRTDTARIHTTIGAISHHERRDFTFAGCGDRRDRCGRCDRWGWAPLRL